MSTVALGGFFVVNISFISCFLAFFCFSLYRPYFFVGIYNFCFGFLTVDCIWPKKFSFRYIPETEMKIQVLFCLYIVCFCIFFLFFCLIKSTSVLGFYCGNDSLMFASFKWKLWIGAWLANWTFFVIHTKKKNTV